MTTRYLLKNIRALLQEGFSEEELRRLCYDEPEFKPLYPQLAESDSKAEIVDRLLEFAEQMLQMDKLLALAREHNSARYEAHQPYVETVALPVPVAKPRRFFGIVLGLSLLGVIALVGVGWWLFGGGGQTRQPIKLPETCQPLDRRVRVAVAELTGCPAEYQKNLIGAWGNQADVTPVAKTFSDSETARASFSPEQTDLGGWGSCEGTTEGQLNFHYELITTRKPDEVYEPEAIELTGSLTETTKVGLALINYRKGDYDRVVTQLDTPDQSKSTADQDLLWANSLLFAEKYEAAITAYTKITELYPDYSAAYNNMGVARFNNASGPGQEGFVVAGISEFERAADLSTKQGQNQIALLAYTNRSDLYRRLGNWSEAKKDCDAAYNINAQSAITHVCYILYNFGLDSGKGIPFDTIKEFLDQAEQSPGLHPAKLYYLYATWHHRQNQREQAIANYKQFLKQIEDRACIQTDLKYRRDAISFLQELTD